MDITDQTDLPTALQYLMPILKGCWDHSVGVHGAPASGSSVRRWIKDKAVHVNGFPVEQTELIDFPVFSIVLFPNNPRKRTTLW